MVQGRPRFRSKFQIIRNLVTSGRREKGKRAAALRLKGCIFPASKKRRGTTSREAKAGYLPTDFMGAFPPGSGNTSKLGSGRLEILKNQGFWIPRGARLGFRMDGRSLASSRPRDTGVRKTQKEQVRHACGVFSTNSFMAPGRLHCPGGTANVLPETEQITSGKGT